ncbi:MAG: FAD-dependent oxidoreductase, partial [Bacteroidota bacterium]
IMAQYNFKHLNHTDIPEEVEIAVVGAGVSGLYSTWKILEQNPRANICILDQIGRIGGRLDSDVIKFKNEATGEVRSVKEEEGGMRFTFDSMDNLMALLMKLNLTDDIVPFPMSSDGNNRLYFRGKPFTNNDSGKDDYAVWSDLYNLEVSEQGTNPKTIINTVYNRILDVNPAFTDSDVFKLSEKTKERGPVFWQAFRLNCAWKGVGLKDWQLQGLLADMGYSTEVINLLYRLSGFNGTFLSEMSAGIAYQLLEEFPKDPKFKTLKLGFSMLTNGMVDAIRSIQPNKRTTVQRIFLRTTVDGIDHSEKDDSFVVNYTQIRGTGVSQTIKTGTIKAKKIILGLPRLALEKLFIGSGVFGKLGTQASARLWNQLQSTSNQPLVKINLYYDRAWWGNGISGQPAVAFGPNFSDTPMGSVYPFYTVDEKIAAALEYARWLRSQKMDIPADIQAILDSKYQMPAALTIYCDYMNVNFWKALQNVGQPYMTEMQRAHKKLLPASEAVVDKATDFFKKLFN